MVTFARVLRDLSAPPPAGCKSPQVRDLLHDFFEPKCWQTANHYWLKYRQFAHYLKLDRGAWPGAIERLFAMKPDDVRFRVRAFRSWIKRTATAKTRNGTERPCMYTLFRLAKERGIISWDYPDAARILENKAWVRVRPDFRDSVATFSDHLRRMNFAPTSVTCRRALIRSLGEWLRARRINHLKVTQDIAGEFVDWVISTEYSDHYKNAIITSCRGFYRWLRVRREIVENPFDGMARFRVRQNLPTVCSEREVLKLIRAAKSPLDRAVIEILYATGCRVSELCSIDLKEVSFDARHIKILGKWRRERMILFNEAAAKAIRDYLPTRAETLRRNARPVHLAAPLLVNVRGTRLTTTRVEKNLKVMARAAGVSDRVTPHAIRHSFATHLLNRGADLYALMQLLGHRNIQATVRYLSVATTRLAEVYRKCHPRK